MALCEPVRSARHNSICRPNCTELRTDRTLRGSHSCPSLRTALSSCDQVGSDVQWLRW